MQNTKLLQLLRTFDQSTITHWRQFAHSPYHNKHRDVQALCDYLHKIFPNAITVGYGNKLIVGLVRWLHFVGFCVVEVCLYSQDIRSFNN